MASVRFREQQNCWEIRKYVTDPVTLKPRRFFEILPKESTAFQRAQIADRLDILAERIKTGKNRIPDTIQRAYHEWDRWI